MPNADKPWFVYLVRCRDGSIYTGITDDVDARLKKHNQGKGAKYTAQRRPVALPYSETHPDQNSARKREIQLKGWTSVMSCIKRRIKTLELDPGVLCGELPVDS